jgi:hypothetical protein
MSLRWWNLAAVFTRKENDETFPFPRPDMRWREGMGVAQLTHVRSPHPSPLTPGLKTQTIGLLQEMLYASPDLTAELIKTGRYASTLHRLKPELDSTWNDQLGDLPPMSVFDSDGDHFTQEELMEIRWRIEFDYVRSVACPLTLPCVLKSIVSMAMPLLCEPLRTGCCDNTRWGDRPAMARWSSELTEVCADAARAAVTDKRDKARGRVVRHRSG